MKASRISESTHFEAYFDLWGFTMGWIEAIADAMHEHCQCSTDECESYKNEACMAVRFTSTDKARTDRAKSIFARLEPLARKASKCADPSKIYYFHS